MVSYSGTAMSTINPPENRVSRRLSSPLISAGGRAVTGEDDLTPGLAHSIQKPEQDLLRFLLPSKELDVVKEKDMEFLVPL